MLVTINLNLAMHFKNIEFASADYATACQLREQVLRTPLGLRLSVNDVMNEITQWHYGVFKDEQLLACLVIKPVDKAIVKLRQMAVLPAYQGKGLGQFLVNNTEQALFKQGIQQIELNARQTAIGFYQRLGYQIYGELFIDISIPHILMKKTLAQQQESS